MGLSIQDDLVDKIYEAALVPNLWPDILQRIGDLVNGSAGFLFGVRDGYVSAVSNPAFAPYLPIFMEEGWSQRDKTLGRAMALNHAGFVIDADLMTDQEIATDEVYHLFRQYGIGYRAGTIVPISNGDSLALVLARHQEFGPVPRSVVTFLDGLRPHLARSALTANRLGFERARAQAEAMQAVGLPAAVLRAGGRLFAANALFEETMPPLFQDRARVALTDPVADAMLADAIAMLPFAGAVKSLPIAAGEGRVPMVAHLVPVRGVANDIFSFATSLLVVIPVDKAAVPTADVLQGLFDLTPAEARVARGIAGALSIDEVAVAQSVSRETVRSQLKSVLTKTGLSRQTELVSLLAGSAIMRQDER